MSITQYVKKDNQPTVFIGMEKNNVVHANHLEFCESVELDLDLILASIVMRHRQVTKKIFNTSDVAVKAQAAKALEIEDFFKIDTEKTLCCETQYSGIGLPKNTLVFFLGSDSVWKLVGNYDILSLQAPLPVLEVYKRYYAMYYPKAVSDFAFADPKNIMRVFQVDEKEGFEDFLFEPLFRDSDIVDHILCPITELNDAA